MHPRSVMGDYSFGIPPNMIPFSSVDYQQTKIESKSFYGDNRAIPEDLLNQITRDKQSESQRHSPNGENLVNPGDGGIEDFGRSKSEGIDVPSNIQMERHMIETASNLGTQCSNLPLEYSDAVVPTTAPSFWSGVTGDDQFNPYVPPPLKNPLSFQNFPNSLNPMFNSNLGPINIPQSLPQQRRAITGAHSFGQSQHQQQQSNLLKNFSSWTNSQSTSWSTPQTPNDVIPWNAMGFNNQKRAVPNVNPVCPQKNNPTIGQHSMIRSPSKFQRSTSLPLNKQYPQSYGGNPPFDMSIFEERERKIFPFQDHQIAGSMNTTSMDGLRFPHEQQLMDIMRNSTSESQDNLKGYANYSANNIQSMGNIPDLCMIMCMNSGCKSSLSDFRNSEVFFNGSQRRLIS